MRAVRHLDSTLLDRLWARTDGEVPEDHEERLGALFATWCRTVPYDTTTKLTRHAADPAAPLWGMDCDEVVAHALDTGLGATCFPLAAAFAAVARADGFDAAVHVATREDAVPSAAPDHAVAVIQAGSSAYLADPAFMHMRPVLLPRRVGQISAAGPRWAPMIVERRDGGVLFQVERGMSRARRWYRLGVPLSDGALGEAYEVAGRWPEGMVPYLRVVRGASMVAATSTDATIKCALGLRRRNLADGAELRAQVGELLGFTDDALEQVCACIEAGRES